MKKILKHFDLVYFIGLAVITFGYGMYTTTFMTGDFLYEISVMFYPLHVVYAGFLIIIVEVFASGHYKRIYHYFIDNLKHGTTSYVIIISVVGFLLSLFVLSPAYSLYLFLVILLGYIIYIFIKNTSPYSIIALLAYILILIRTIALLSGSLHYNRIEIYTLDINIVLYFIFIVTSLIAVLRKTETFNILLAIKVLFSLIIVNVILFNVQYNTFKLDYFHEDETLNVTSNPLFTYDYCPEGYGGLFVRENEDFTIECVPLNTGIVTMRDRGYVHLGIIYFSLIVVSIVYSKVPNRLEKIDQIHQESASDMSAFLEKKKDDETKT